MDTGADKEKRPSESMEQLNLTGSEALEI